MNALQASIGCQLPSGHSESDQGCQGVDASTPQQTACQHLWVSKTLREMDGKWKNSYIFFIKV